ncbi:ATP-binding protein [Pseudomonas sp. S1Bt30]|uniref:ATP-binding protein n=1 Tax=Pseudomonas quebecensis TaxID=2995174 RepID=A0ABY6QPI4_9PSED|nr:ATP-binding protein [Pseudomonas quebecensis]MCX4067533.1 ATP-binding protein [Pseudomonas quebecensis]UZW20888.1 ATP-binding protein [Pseudomonas quebecensis]UZW21695.1 ATP-binding protein [Pseudomonas quebecensis]UZW26754.1 ATP-binding protein [Pseudomonas quebecensis]
MKHYSPFTKSFNDIKTEDLLALRDVNEGWYVEYKQAISKSTAIAKSISAFANSYGGWIFYGIKEHSKENSVAGEFIGIENSELDAALQKIRQAVANMSPACHFETKTLYGPCEAIGLKPDRAIVCLVVPQSIEAPHVHSGGYIYRRVADGSEPVPETDRYMVEKLFDRSKTTIGHYKKWHDNDPEFSKGESNSPFLRIMIKPNLWELPRSDFTFNLDSVKEILGAVTGRAICLPFDTIYPRAGGIIARQCKDNNPTNLSITWDLQSDLTSDITIPLNWCNGNIHDIRAFLHGYKQTAPFVEKLESTKIETTSVVDLNHLHHVLFGIVEAQRALQKKAGWPLDFHLKIKLLNVWRTIPFLDVPHFIKNIDKNGIPMCLTSNVTAPPGYHPETFAHVEDHSNGESNNSEIIIQTLFSFAPIADAYGIPILNMILAKHTEEDGFLSLALSEASKRAMEVQAIRQSYR